MPARESLQRIPRVWAWMRLQAGKPSHAWRRWQRLQGRELPRPHPAALFIWLFIRILCYFPGLPWWLSSKEPTCSAGDTSLIPTSGRFPGRGNGNPFQDSCLKNPMDTGAWEATVHGVTKSWTRLKRLSMAFTNNSQLENVIRTEITKTSHKIPVFYNVWNFFKF